MSSDPGRVTGNRVYETTDVREHANLTAQSLWRSGKKAFVIDVRDAEHIIGRVIHTANRYAVIVEEPK